MDIISLYHDVIDRTATEQNGEMGIEKFNRYNRLGGLRMLDFISGDISGITPPEPYSTEKVRDWLSLFITTDTKQVQSGTSPKPENFYRYESLSMIGDYRDEVCGKDVLVSNGNTPIELLDALQFDSRCQTYIKSLKPSAKKPIAKMVGSEFHYMPKDVGSVKLEYVRYPIFGEIKIKFDAVYNEQVPDPATSIDSEFPDYARELIVYFITKLYSAGTRERALVEQNEVVAKTVRG